MSSARSNDSGRMLINQGAYQIRQLDPANNRWVPVAPIEFGSYAKMRRAMSRMQIKLPRGTKLRLFYLVSQPKSNRIVWAPCDDQANYSSKNRDRLLQLFFHLGLQLDAHGYEHFSQITGVALGTLKKFLRAPYDDSYTPLSSQGLRYIEYKVQEYMDEKSRVH